MFSVFQDFIAATLPTLLFWDLKVSPKRKVLIIGLFALGYIICIIGGVRIYYLWKVYYHSWDSTCEYLESQFQNLSVFLADLFIPGNGGLLIFWSSVESLLAITCASAPSLKVSLPCYCLLWITTNISNSATLTNRLIFYRVTILPRFHLHQTLIQSPHHAHQTTNSKATLNLCQTHPQDQGVPVIASSVYFPRNIMNPKGVWILLCHPWDLRWVVYKR